MELRIRQKVPGVRYFSLKCGWCLQKVLLAWSFCKFSCYFLDEKMLTKTHIFWIERHLNTGRRKWDHLSVRYFFGPKNFCVRYFFAGKNELYFFARKNEKWRPPTYKFLQMIVYMYAFKNVSLPLCIHISSNDRIHVCIHECFSPSLNTDDY